MALPIDERLTLPDDEIAWTASRASGPGGQNVNKVNSKVTVSFDIARSPSLDETTRARLLEQLASRLSAGGVLRVSSQAARTQPANLRLARARLAQLLRDALQEDPPRIGTRPSAAARRRRRDEKARVGAIKRMRRTPPGDD